jgi:hypothetical protein
VKWRQENPKLFGTIVKVTAGAVALAGAFAGIRLAVAGVQFAWSGLLLTGRALAASLSIIGSVGIATFAGIGLAIGVASFFVWKYWKPIKAWFDGFWKGIAEGWKTAGGPAAVEEVKSAFKQLGEATGGFFEPVKMTNEELEKTNEHGKKLGKTLGGDLAQLVRDLAGAVRWLADSFKAVGEMIQAAGEYLDDFGKEASRVADEIGKAFAPIGKFIGDWDKSWGGPERRERLKKWWGSSSESSGGTVAPKKEEKGSNFMERWGYDYGKAKFEKTVPPAFKKETSFVPPSLRGGGNVTIGNINVHGAPGQDERAIAAAVVRQIEEKQAAARRGSYSDELAYG